MLNQNRKKKIYKGFFNIAYIFPILIGVGLLIAKALILAGLITAINVMVVLGSPIILSVAISLVVFGLVSWSIYYSACLRTDATGEAQQGALDFLRSSKDNLANAAADQKENIKKEIINHESMRKLCTQYKRQEEWNMAAYFWGFMGVFGVTTGLFTSGMLTLLSIGLSVTYLVPISIGAICLVLAAFIIFTVIANMLYSHKNKIGSNKEEIDRILRDDCNLKIVDTKDNTSKEVISTKNSIPNPSAPPTEDPVQASTTSTPTAPSAPPANSATTPTTSTTPEPSAPPPEGVETQLTTNNQ